MRNIPAELREAIAAESFERAGALLGEYAASLATADRAALGEAVGVCAGLRRLAVARRAHLAARLDELNRLAPYLERAPERRRLQIEG